MADSWGKYKNGQIPTSAMYPISPGKYLRPDAAHAFIAAVAEADRHGIKLTAQEAYRPLGIPADQYVRDEAKTSTRSFNQWYAWGIYQRGGPLAAKPGNSVHGLGLAADTTPGRENGQIAAIMKAHGFVYDIPSETWHAHFIGVPAPTPEPSLVQKRTWKGLQGYLKQYWGYSGAIDGAPGKLTWTACQKWLAAHWLYKGAIDGVPGPQTYTAMQRAGCKLR
jgi:D-alanyl-D-alanine dipeptidase